MVEGKLVVIAGQFDRVPIIAHLSSGPTEIDHMRNHWKQK
jgi:hypothetical protein